LRLVAEPPRFGLKTARFGGCSLAPAQVILAASVIGAS